MHALEIRVSILTLGELLYKTHLTSLFFSVRTGQNLRWRVTHHLHERVLFVVLVQNCKILGHTTVMLIDAERRFS